MINIFQPANKEQIAVIHRMLELGIYPIRAQMSHNGMDAGGTLLYMVDENGHYRGTKNENLETMAIIEDLKKTSWLTLSK